MPISERKVESENSCTKACATDNGVGSSNGFTKWPIDRNDQTAIATKKDVPARVRYRPRDRALLEMMLARFVICKDMPLFTVQHKAWINPIFCGSRLVPNHIGHFP